MSTNIKRYFFWISAGMLMLFTVMPALAQTQTNYYFEGPVKISVGLNNIILTAPNASTNSAKGVSPVKISIAAPKSEAATLLVITNTGPVDISVPVGYGVVVNTMATVAPPAAGVVAISAAVPPADVLVTVTTEPAKLVLLSEDHHHSLPGFDIMVGSLTLNPYKVVTNGTNGYKLENDNTETSLIIMINYARRWAWAANSRTEDQKWKFFGQDRPNNLGFDFQTRAAYVFGENATNASTIIGSGDLSLDLKAGWQIARKADDDFAESINLEAGVSVVTDRQFSDSHLAATLGPAYVTSFQGPFQVGTPYRIYLMLAGGLAYYELPGFTGKGDTTLEINDIGNPEFHHHWGGFMEMEAKYQLSPGSFISAGAKIFPNKTIAPWSLWIGYSATIGQIEHIITSPFQSTTNTATPAK